MSERNTNRKGRPPRRTIKDVTHCVENTKKCNEKEQLKNRPNPGPDNRVSKRNNSNKCVTNLNTNPTNCSPDMVQGASPQIRRDAIQANTGPKAGEESMEASSKQKDPPKRQVKKSRLPRPKAGLKNVSEPKNGRRIFFGDQSSSDDETDQTTKGADKKGANSRRKSKKKEVKGICRFRKFVRSIINARKVFCWECPPKLTQQENILFFLDIPNMCLPQPGSPVTKNKSQQQNVLPKFDVSLYRGIKEQQQLSCMREMLQVTPAVRSDDQVSSIVRTMQTYGKFSSYPQHVQNDICQHGWYTRFQDGRVIVRQGYPASVFYFILNGVALSRRLERSTDAVDGRRKHQAVFLRKGDTIGELELLQDRMRESTVVCKEALEVLGLDKNDFLDIFKSNQGIECINYLREREELEDFPLELLQVHPFATSLHWYRRGTVVTRNCNESDWIYIIRQGSCQVFKSMTSGRLSRRSRAGSEIYHSDSELVLPKIKSKHTDGGHMHRHSSMNLMGSTLSPGWSSVEQLPLINPGDHYLVGSVTHKDNKDHFPAQKQKKYAMKGPISPSVASNPWGQFAQLGTLTEGTCFGLQTIIYEDTPGLALVSNGAECVLVSKNFLRDNMDAVILRRLRQKVAPYPSSDSLQTALEHSLLWDQYKEHVLSEFINRYNRP